MSDAESKPGDIYAQGVSSWNTRTGAVELTLEDITDAGGAPLTSPHLLGAPTAPTPPPTAAGSEIATAGFVKGLIAASGGGGGEGGGTILQAVSPSTGSTLITVIYNSEPEGGVPAGLAWCHLFDNPVYAWIVDPAGSPIKPVIIGTLPDWTPPDTGEVESPRWVVREKHQIYIPDIARGNANWLFNYLAYNNGAQRPLYADFSDVDLAGAWQVWSRINPGMALKDNPMEGAARIDPAREA